MADGQATWDVLDESGAMKGEIKTGLTAIVEMVKEPQGSWDSQ